MSRTLLVTGATGFIGRALALRSAAAGHRLRLLVRDERRAAALGLPESSLVRGSLEDRGALRAAIEGVDVVVHLAGATRALRRSNFDTVNREGTKHVVEAAARHAAGARFVLVSSLAAAGPSVDGSASVLHPDQCRPVSAYGRSKLGGEHELLRHGRDLEWIVVRPPVVYGPHDDGTRLLFRQALAPFVPVPWRARPLSLIHVDDLVRALAAAIDRREVRSVFVPVEGPDRVDTTTLMERAALACGRRARTVPVPLFVPRAAAPLAELWSRWRGRAGFFNGDKMAELSAPGWVCDPEPARRLLGFTPRIPTEDGLRAVLADDPEIARRAGVTPATC